MDWTTIALSFLGLLSGGGLATFVRLKSTKRGGDIDNYSNLVKVISELKDELQEALQENIRLRGELSDSRNESTTKGYSICTHYGCACRKPAIGRGATYFKMHKDEEDFGADYTPIEDLVSEYKRKRYQWGQKPPKSLDEYKNPKANEED